MSNVGPTKIGKYEIERVVGEGAMGIVYRANDPVLNRPVAIKIMSDALAKDSDLRERFLREAQAAGSLQHPNVITIYDFGDVDGHPYIAMEFVEGTDLDTLLSQHIPISLSDQLDLVTGVLQGLAYAHKRGIVHRDIKPANIRVDDEGKARIMDFGVAHLMSSSMTRTGVTLGTPSYMAPEQIVGDKISPATDLFSVGAVLYELLSGVRAFQGDTLQNVMYRVLTETPPPFATIAPHLPARLDQIVSRAMAKNAEDRYASALDMANDLMAVRSALVGGGSAPVMSLRATIDSALASQRSAATKKHRRTVVLGGTGVVAVALIGVTAWALAHRSPIAVATAPVIQSSGSPAAETPSVGRAPTLTSPKQSSSANDAKRRGTSSPPIAVPPSKDAVAERKTPDAPARGGTVTTPTVPRQATDTQPAPATRPPAPPPSASNGATTSTGGAQLGATTSSGAVHTVTPPVAPPVAAPSNPPSPIAPAKPDVNSTAEIHAVIDAYARSIESRDVGQLRQVYAGITSDQQHAFSDFFSSTRSLKAALTVQNLQIDGVDAVAQIAGTYDFVTNAGRDQHQDVSFHAELHLARGAWRLVAVR